ncbi:MAG: hypothetical protein HY996_03260 [Micrococcales bacterium]|nr:hypothetical protein [Micrococcales bacterium]
MIAAWVLVLAAAGCGAGRHEAPDANALDDAGRDAGRDAGEDAAIDAGRPCANPPAIVGTYELDQPVVGVAAQGAIVLVASSNPALLVLDASDPGNIVEVTDRYPDRDGSYVLWSGDRAIMGLRADIREDCMVLDMSSPLSPSDLGALPENPAVAHLATPFAYGGTGLVDLLVFDVAERSGPTLIARSRVPGGYETSALAIGDDVAFIGEETMGGEVYQVHAIDISDPSAPAYAGVLVPPGIDVGGWFLLALPNDLLYYREDGLKLLDVSDIADPRPVGTVDEPEGFLVGLVANLLFYANPDPDSPDGTIMGIAPLEDLLAPRIEWTVRLPGGFWLPAVADGVAYVAAVTPGPSDTLFVVDLGCAVQ